MTVYIVVFRTEYDQFDSDEGVVGVFTDKNEAELVLEMSSDYRMYEAIVDG